MSQKLFIYLLFSLHIRIRAFIIKRVKTLTPRPKDEITLIDELVENIEIECCKIPYEQKSPLEAEKAIWTKVKDTWAQYCRQLGRKKEIENDIAYITSQNDTCQNDASQDDVIPKASQADGIELWNRLRQKITPTEESLYIAIARDGYSFKQLGELLNKKPATLRQAYRRIRLKLKGFLEEELAMIAK